MQGGLSIDFEVSVGHLSGNVPQTVEYTLLKFSRVLAEVIELRVINTWMVL